MTPRTLLTVSATAGLFTLYVAYALVMNSVIGVQLLEARKPPQVAPPERPQESLALARTYLADQAPWATEARYLARSHGAFMYYQEWHQEPWGPKDEDNALRFKPFATIWQRSTTVPYTIVSEEAKIRFARAFGPKDPDTGRPVAGELHGLVRITGPDGLVIEGRDFTYSEDAQRIFSDEPVAFRQGTSRGTAAGGVQIDVLIDDAAVLRDEFAVAGIHNITLLGDIELHLRPESEDPEAGPVIVNCSGSLDFNTETNIATFHKDVRVRRPTEGGLYDYLEWCDKLKLVFEPRPEETPQVAAAVEPPAEEEPAEKPKKKRKGQGSDPETTEDDADQDFQGIPSDLAFVRLQALGSRMRLVSELNQMTAEMQELRYDAEHRIASLDSLDHKRTIQVTKEQSQLFTEKLTLQHDEENRISLVLCDSPGTLLQTELETQQTELDARWAHQLRMSPDPKTGLYQIELGRRASLRQPLEGFELTADYIKLWVGRKESAGESAAEPNGAAPPITSWDGGDMVPRNMLAVQNVHLQSPELHGNTERFEVWFIDRPVETGPLTRADELAPAASAASAAPASRLPEVRPYRVGFGGQFSVRDDLGAGGDPAEAPPSPLVVTADLIQLEVERGNETQQGESQQGGFVRRAITTGHVRIRQDQGPGEDSLSLDGDLIRVENRDRTNEDQLVRVYGKPAHIQQGEMRLIGNELVLDRGANRASVNGPGVMQTLVDSDLEQNSLDEPQTLNVWWKEKMVFDGLRADFFEDVRTQLGDSSVLCQEMEVTLSRRINFRNTPQAGAEGREKTDLARLHCKYGVEFESQAFAQSKSSEAAKLSELRRGQFGELVYERSTGKTTASGPGWMAAWFLREGREGGAKVEGSTRVTANRSLHVQETEWNYLRIDFHGDVDGNLNSQLTHFQDRVRVVYGPVEKPLDTIDSVRLTRNAGWMRCESLDVARHPPTDDREAWMELQASGNVELQGEMFRALADSVTYDESKRLYGLRSQGKTGVSLFRQARPGEPAQEVNSQSILFSPETNFLKTERTTSFEGSN